MPIQLVITGGQTGADQAGLRAARAAGIATGGFAPKGWETEDGPAPWLADWGLVECTKPGYPARTEANVRAADVVFLFGDPSSRGGKLTAKWCSLAGRRLVVVEEGLTRPSHLVELLTAAPYLKVVMIAGNRESGSPGIGDRVERFLGEVFRRLGLGDSPVDPNFG